MHTKGATRNLSVRIPQDLFEQLAFLAKLEDQTLGELIRRAAHDYSQSRFQDDEVLDRAEKLREEMNLYLSASNQV